MNSRNKGKVGEREFASFLRDHGFDARRGQQFSGSPESPDVVSPALPWLHVEVKRVQNLNLAAACVQASRDSAGKPWIVAHRRNHAPWLITMDAELFFQLLRGTSPVAAPQATGKPAETTSGGVIELRGAEAAAFLSKVIPRVSPKTISSPVLADGHKAGSDQPTEQTKQQEQNV